MCLHPFFRFFKFIHFVEIYKYFRWRVRWRLLIRNLFGGLCWCDFFKWCNFLNRRFITVVVSDMKKPSITSKIWLIPLGNECFQCLYSFWNRWCLYRWIWLFICWYCFLSIIIKGERASFRWKAKGSCYTFTGPIRAKDNSFVCTSLSTKNASKRKKKGRSYKSHTPILHFQFFKTLILQPQQTCRMEMYGRLIKLMASLFIACCSIAYRQFLPSNLF